jgi:flagellar assembly protein FliH
MSAPAKFLFDLDFGAPPKPKVEPIVEPTFSKAELQASVAAAEARGHQQGMNAAEAQIRTQAERQTAAAFDRIAAGIGILATQLPGITGRLEIEAIDVAVAVARKLAPALVAARPLAEIEALVSACFRELISAPHVVVRVNDGLYELARERLGEMTRARGFEGRLVVLGEAEIAPGDCRIEWADGGLIRDRAAIEASIADAVSRYVAGRPDAAA